MGEKKNALTFREVSRGLCESGKTPRVCEDLWPGGAHYRDEIRLCDWQNRETPSSGKAAISINIITGLWIDHRDGKRGDIVEAYSLAKGISKVLAKDELQTKYLENDTIAPVETKIGSLNRDEEIIKPPPGVKPSCHLRGMDLISVHCYTDESGDPLYYIARYFNPAKNKKEIRPWCYNGVKGRFVCRGWPGERYLYNVHRIINEPEKPVIVVEGEKCADALEPFPVIPVTWPGGAASVSRVNIKPLIGRKKVLLWPDADAPGISAMEKMAKRIGGQVKMVVPTSKPEKWDVADAIQNDNWSWTDIKTFIRSNTTMAQFTQVKLQMDPDERTSTAIAAGSDARSIWPTVGISTTSNGMPIVNEATIKRILSLHPYYKKNPVYFDEFHGRITIGGRKLTDADYRYCLTSICQESLELNNVKEKSVVTGMQSYADEHRINAPVDKIRQKKWDGISRVDRLFIDGFGAKEDEYSLDVGRIFCLSLLARLTMPGCKQDFMVIIEGYQGVGKSRGLAILGGDLYRSVSCDVARNENEFLKVLEGAAIIEIEEMVSLERTSPARVKQLITTQEDTYRRSYARNPQTFPRRCVLVGTTNEYHYLRDSTGLRRFLPIRSESVSWDWIGENRDQILAEALARVEAGEDWHLPKNAIRVEEEQRKRFVSDPWCYAIKKLLKLRSEVSEEEAISRLGYDIREMDIKRLKRLRHAMQSLGLVLVEKEGTPTWILKK